jgi:hypothetical protein
MEAICCIIQRRVSAAPCTFLRKSLGRNYRVNTSVSVPLAPKSENHILFFAKRLAEDSGLHDQLTSATNLALLHLSASVQAYHRSRRGTSWQLTSSPHLLDKDKRDAKG